MKGDEDLPIGVIDMVNYKRGFGFIYSSVCGKVFFHFSALEDKSIDYFKRGEKVEFEFEEGKKGLRATLVKKIQTPAKDINVKSSSGDTRCEFCYAPNNIILEEIQKNKLPDDVLIRNCCWKKICASRSWGKTVDPEIWSDICKRRRHLLLIENLKYSKKKNEESSNIKIIPICLECRKKGDITCPGPSATLGSYNRINYFCGSFSRKKRN